MRLAQCPVIFDGLTHTYWFGDSQLKGVTSLMKDHGLGADYAGIDPEVLARAAARGTEIHSLLEAYDNGQAVADTPELKAYRKLGLNILCSEYLVSDLLTVASSIDKVVYVDEHTVDLADVKTTSNFHRDAVSVQLSIYEYLFNLANPDIKVRNLFGIHVRDGKAKIIEVPRWGSDNVTALIEAERNGLPFIPKEDDKVCTTLTVDEMDALLTAETKIQDFKAAIKTLEEMYAESKSRLIDYMIANHVSEVKADGGVWKLKDAYTTERIDSTAFKKDMPELAAKYTKTSTVKASVSYKAGTN